MSNFRMPKGRILFLMSLVYLFAFASLYVQLPGLYSRNGILPVDKLALSPMVKWQDFLTNPSLLRLSHLVQLDQYDALELVTLLGTLVALLATLFGTFRTMSSFIVLWLCYFACYQSGQVFMHFQWDILLLEAGFLTILLAGADILFVIPLPKHVASDRLALYMMKWLLFRLMFASGVVKLTSECPAWWSLKALNYHFETQCIPTPVAFWAHSLPEWLLKLGVVVTFYVEILVPFFFFVPLRMIRKFSFYSQVLLQLAIMLTGNYNFFNLLTITLCYSLLTDCDFGLQRPVVQYTTAPKQQQSKKQKDQKKSAKTETVVVRKADECSRWGCLLSVLLIVASLVATGLLFRIRLSPDQTHLQSDVAFDKKTFASALTPLVQYSCYLSLLGFLLVFYLSLRDSIRQSAGCLSTSYQLLGLLTVAAIAAPLMLASTTEFALGIQPAVAKSLPAPFHRVRSQLEPWQVTSHYGLFRRMTTKRNELVVEYAQSEQGPWESVVFHHKPGPENAGMPSVVAPHQPRLDWQMWFAALSDQPPVWLYSLVRGLLAGHEEIRQLVRWPAAKQAPKFVRVSRFEAHFQQPAKSLSAAWPAQFWQTKRLSSDHLPVCSLDSPLLKTHLTKAGLWAATKPAQPSRNALLANLLRDIRTRIGQPRDIYPLLGVVLLILLTKRFLLRR